MRQPCPTIYSDVTIHSADDGGLPAEQHDAFEILESVHNSDVVFAGPARSVDGAGVGERSVNVPPPELPVYDQPPIPGDGYVWTPGYWAWGDDIQDYYWVPGTWVPAPEPEYLWTPGYWAATGVAFFWHPGYWGPHVGFYGGVNYGYGYGGRGL